MRIYLCDFMKECAYDEKDAQTLLAAYDRIAADQEAKALFEEACAVYEADNSVQDEAAFYGRTRRISECTGVHDYTTELLVFMAMTKHLKALYLEKGISMQIYLDTVLDLKWKLEECKAVKGICGSFVSPWFFGFFDLTRFALGRLQFELVTMERSYETNEVRLEAGKSKVINVHIPRTGTPLDRESCEQSYTQARAFFRDQIGEKAVFVCDSWLLYPENKRILPSNTNTYRFLSEYDIIDWKVNFGEDLWRLFDTEEKNPDRLPTDSTMRRCYAAHLKQGGRVGSGFGVKV